MVFGAASRDTPIRGFKAAPLLVLLLCVAGVNVPFLNQAFHMDDGIYLLLAQNVHRNPWFPQDSPILFEGLYATDLASTEHPWPFTSYLMALCGRIGGLSEPCLHLGFLVFPIVLACSMYSISRRFTHHPALASMTVIVLPPVCVLSHTLMTDIPLLALWLASAALFLRGVDSGRMRLVWLGAAVAALASLVSYAGFCLIPLLALYAISWRKPSAALIALIVPATIFASWTATNYFHYQRVTPGLLLGSYLFVKRVLSTGLLMQKSTYIVIALGGVTIFPFFLIALGRKTSILIGFISTIAAGFGMGAAKYDALQKAFLLVFFCAGLVAIVEVVRALAHSLATLKSDLQEAADELFLSLWFVGMLVFCTTVYMTGSARYLLPATPPLVLIFFRCLERALDETGLRRIAFANLALSGLLALLLSLADYQFAAIYRDFASALRSSHPGRAGNLWFTGEWGFRAYLEHEGGQELGRRDPRPKPGDLLIVPSLATPYQTLFGDRLSLESMVMVAPSRVVFDIPPVPPDGSLIYTIGMPFYDKSDGMGFIVRFLAPDADQVLHQGYLLPADGRRWQVQEISLRDIAGKHGSIVFEAAVGGSGNADADWLAIARARICERNGKSETLLYDFRDHLNMARIEPASGVQYHTNQNVPAFPMTVWLEQEPATILRGRYEYRPALPLRLLEAQWHAGFWSSGWGLLPFSLATRGSVLESVSVYEITREVDAYGESTPSWYQQ